MINKMKHKPTMMSPLDRYNALWIMGAVLVITGLTLAGPLYYSNIPSSITIAGAITLVTLAIRGK